MNFYNILVAAIKNKSSAVKLIIMKWIKELLFRRYLPCCPNNNLGLWILSAHEIGMQIYLNPITAYRDQFYWGWTGWLSEGKVH